MNAMFKTITLKHVIGVIILLTFSISHVTTLFHLVPKENEGIINHSLGILDAVTTAIVFFYYGSSSGSKDKSELLEDITRKNNP